MTLLGQLELYGVNEDLELGEHGKNFKLKKDWLGDLRVECKLEDFIELLCYMTDRKDEKESLIKKYKAIYY